MAYGNCYTFNSALDGRQPRITTRRGSVYGKVDGKVKKNIEHSLGVLDLGGELKNNNIYIVLSFSHNSPNVKFFRRIFYFSTFVVVVVDYSVLQRIP